MLYKEVIEALERHNCHGRVLRIEVEVGRMTCVDPHFFSACFSSIVEHTPLAGAQLRVTSVDPTGRCKMCGNEQKLDSVEFACRVCSSSDMEVIRGADIILRSIEVDDGN